MQSRSRHRHVRQFPGPHHLAAPALPSRTRKRVVGLNRGPLRIIRLRDEDGSDSLNRDLQIFSKDDRI